MTIKGSNAAIQIRKSNWRVPQPLIRQRIGDITRNRVQQSVPLLHTRRPRLADDTDRRARLQTPPAIDPGVHARNARHARNVIAAQRCTLDGPKLNEDEMRTLERAGSHA